MIRALTLKLTGSEGAASVRPASLSTSPLIRTVGAAERRSNFRKTVRCRIGERLGPTPARANDNDKYIRISLDSKALDRRLNELINDMREFRQDLTTTTQEMNNTRLHLDTTGNNLGDLRRELDINRQDSNRRFDAIHNAEPRRDAAIQDLSRHLDVINQDLQRRLDTFNLNISMLDQRLNTATQNLNNLTQQLETANQDFNRRLHRLSHHIYHAQPCCTIM